MNIDRSDVNRAVDNSSYLESLYKRIPRWRKILAAVRAGHAEFLDALAQMGILEFGVRQAQCTRTTKSRFMLSSWQSCLVTDGGDSTKSSEVCLYLDRQRLR